MNWRVTCPYILSLCFQDGGQVKTTEVIKDTYCCLLALYSFIVSPLKCKSTDERSHWDTKVALDGSSLKSIIIKFMGKSCRSSSLRLPFVQNITLCCSHSKS